MDHFSGGIPGDEAVTTLLAFRQDMLNKKALAKTATEELAQGLPISAIDSEPWRLMLRYARDFAGEIFSDREEPKLATGETCVLCQQTLDADADERMRKFDAFIIDKAATESVEAARHFAELVATTKGLHVRPAKEVLALLEGFAAMSEDRTELSNRISSYFTKLTERLTALRTLIEEDKFDGFDGFDPLPEEPIADIEAALKELGAEILALEKEGQDEERLQRLSPSFRISFVQGG